MKLFIASILFSLFFIIDNFNLKAQYVRTPGTFKQKNDLTFPIMASWDLQGGAVSGIDRYTFPIERRQRGMLFMDQNTDSIFQLLGGTDDINWTPLSLGGGTSYWQPNGSDIYYDTGFVGIGTSAPAYNLHVVGNSYLGDTINLNSGYGYLGKIVIKDGIKIGYDADHSGPILIGGSMYGYNVFNQNVSAGNIGIGYDNFAMTVTGGGNLGIGIYAGYNLTSGYNNVFVGRSAGEHISVGHDQVCIGYQAGNGQNGYDCVSIGHYAGYVGSGDAGHDNFCSGLYSGFTIRGSHNIYIGEECGYHGNLITAKYDNNIMFGEKSGRDHAGNCNIFIGAYSGYDNSGGRNIFIGDSVGYNADVSNQLRIDNTNTANPLIKGDFAANTIMINGSLSYSDKTLATGVDSILVREANKIKYALTDDITNNNITWTGIHTFNNAITQNGASTYNYGGNVSDDASITLPNSTAGWGKLMAGDGDEFACFRWKSDGSITLLTDITSNISVGDVDTDICFIDGGTQVSIKNRLGSTKKLSYEIHYFTP